MSDVEIKPDNQRALKEYYERTVKIANYLFVAQGAGLVGCLSLIQDYADHVQQLKGLGLFITLFGSGLIFAIVYFASATSLIILSADKPEYKIPNEGWRPLGNTLISLTFLGAVLSSVMLIGAVIAIIVKFRSL